MTKKVAIVLGYLELGGAERQAIYLAEFLHRQPDIIVVVVGFTAPGAVSQILSEKNIIWKSVVLEPGFKKKTVLKNCFILLKYFWKIKPDVILPYTYRPNLLCGLIWRLTSAKICIWNQRDEGRGIMGSRLERLALRNVSSIVSNSLEGKLFLKEKFDISPDAIKIIHNGVALNVPQHEATWWYQALGIDAETFVVSMVANLHIHKDHATLINAWKLFTDRIGNKKAVLLLAGRLDDMHYYLKALAYDLRLYDSLRFLGTVQDIPGLFRITDLVVFSSRKEGCPNSVLEAMKAGKPVVATNITGTREALGNDYPYLAEPGNSEDFSQKIYAFYQDRTILKEVGLRNEKYVTAKFSLVDMQNTYLSLIQRGA